MEELINKLKNELGDIAGPKGEIVPIGAYLREAYQGGYKKAAEHFNREELSQAVFNLCQLLPQKEVEDILDWERKRIALRYTP